MLSWTKRTLLATAGASALLLGGALVAQPALVFGDDEKPAAEGRDKPREGERPRGEPDRPREGGPRDGDRPREGGPRDGDRPREGGPRDGDRPREGGPRDGDRPREGGPREGDRPREGGPREPGRPREGDRPREGGSPERLPGPREGGPRDGDRPRDGGPREGGRPDGREGPDGEGGAELRELLRQDHELEIHTMDLARQIHRPGTPADRQEKLKAELTETVRKHFKVRQERRELDLKRLEAELERLRATVKNHQEKAEDVIQRRINILMGNEMLEF